MPWYLTLILFLVIFSLLVLVHEWGHFFVARKTGIKVEEFGIGFPPRVKKLFTDKKGTLYSLNALPIGGFVKLYGENADSKVLKSKQSFAGKKLWQRIAVVVAGVFMNFLLAWVLISIGFMVGMKPFLISPQDVEWAIEENYFEGYGLYVQKVLPGSAFEGMDLPEHPVITHVNGQPILSFEAFAEAMKPSEPTLLQIQDAQSEAVQTLTLTPNEEGKIGVELLFQPLLSSLKTVQYPVLQAPWAALKETARLSWATVELFGGVIKTLFTRFEVAEGVGGPVAIFQETGRAAERGIMDLLQFTALISISLGVINIMPIPALDGGRLLFLLVEGVIRRRPSPKYENVVHFIGFIFLMGLILLVTWKDISRLIS